MAGKRYFILSFCTSTWLCLMWQMCNLMARRLFYRLFLRRERRWNPGQLMQVLGKIRSGNIWNASSYSAYSTGLGLSASYKNIYASLALGITLKRDYAFTTKKVSNTRFDFIMSTVF